MRIQVRSNRDPVLFVAYVDARGSGMHDLQSLRRILRLQLRTMILLCPRLRT